LTRRITSAKFRRPEALGGFIITLRILTPRFLLVLTLLLAACAADSVLAQSGIPTWQPPKTGLGYDVDLDVAPSSRPGPIRAREVEVRGAQPLYVRLLFTAPDAAAQGGVPLGDLEAAVDAYRDAGFEVILAPRGGAALSGAVAGEPAQEPEAVAQWRAFLRSAAERFKGRVRFYQLEALSGAIDGAGAEQARKTAFLIKKGAVELRGADPQVLVVTETLPADRLDYLSALFGEDTAAYVDVVALRSASGDDLEEITSKATMLLLEKDPSASLWMLGESLPAPPPPAAAAGEAGDSAAPAPEPAGEATGPPRGASLIHKAASAFAGGARLVSFELHPDATGSPELANLLVLLRRLFPPTVAPAPEGVAGLKLRARDGGGELPLRAWRFFDASTFQVLLVYLSPAGATGTADLMVDTSDVTGAVVDDLLANSENPVPSLQSDPAARATRVEVPLAPTPLILRYQRFATPGYLKGPESAQVETSHELTAEEIIARHQEFQADQDRRLQSVMAEAVISYHYTVASARFSIDVSTRNRFFWDRATGAEWEQLDFYFNGVRWTGKKPPDLPLIQPEKVVTLPLDLHLDKSYEYRLLGTDAAEGRDCYLLEFIPREGQEHLYRGRVWIDRKSFAKVRVSSVQTGLEPPVTSNDERDDYGPAPGSGENPLWVLQRIDGQQRHTLAGVNLIVLREVRFTDFILNSPDFEARRQEAYASDHTMMRDTQEGFRYLDRSEAGQRTVRTTQTRSTLLGAVGLYRQQNLDYPVIPLLGVDYFSFDFRHTKNQVNFFFAGAILQASWQNPSVGKTKVDAGASVLGIAFSATDRYYVGDEEIETVAVRQRPQALSANLGYPLGNFFKVKALASVDYEQFGHSEDAAGSFVVPSDTMVLGFGGQGQFDRRGWTVQARAQRFHRTDWEPWGDRDPASAAVGSLYSEFDPDDATFLRYQGQISKQIVLPYFQKVIVDAEYLTGDRLDRFSKYQFSFFDTRVRGFSGSGVRFDRGTRASGSYLFNLANVVRFQATVDWARVRNEDLSAGDPELGGLQRFTGAGISGNFMGPWNTLFQFDYGIAVQSDIPGLKGEQEFEILLFKFF
jgi:hypothetical protein